MSAGFQDSYVLVDDKVRNYVINLLEHAALVDHKGRELFVVVGRRRPIADKDDPEEKARRLMHVFIGQLAKEAGCTPNEMRADLAAHFLPPVERVNHATGEIISEAMSTNDLHLRYEDSSDPRPTLSDFIGWIQQLASEHYNLQLKSINEPEPDLSAPTRRSRRNGENVA